MTTRRNLLKAAAAAPAVAVAGALTTPAVAQAQITWRMQTYAGPALAAHVVKPAIDMFNKIAGERMQIELFFSDQIVPTGELFRSMQGGTIDAVQSDDDSMASPTEVTVFGGYFPFASRYSLDVPVLFNQYGLNEIWAAEYEKVGIKHISAGAWDPCHFATKDPIHSLADLEGKRVFTFPTAGRFLTQFGVVPVTLPWEDIEVAMQTGELDGVSWSGITEDYTVGWADVTNYFLTNNISGAWIGSFYANIGTLERDSRGPPDPAASHLRSVPLLPPVVVLGRRGQPARPRDEDAADLDPPTTNGPRSKPRHASSGTKSRPNRKPKPRWSRYSSSTTRTWRRPEGPTVTADRQMAAPCSARGRLPYCLGACAVGKLTTICSSIRSFVPTTYGV